MNDEVKKYYLKNKDEQYVLFSKKLGLNSKYKMIGVRIPLLRKYAKELSKNYSIDTLMNEINDEYYEDILLKGFIIGNYKLPYQEVIDYIKKHVKKISDWSLCDTFVSSLKIVKKYPKEFFKLILKYLNSKKEFEIRFALVMLLDYYLMDDYKDDVLTIIKKVDSDKYYVKMANAWLISYMLIYYYNDMVNILRENNIDRWTAVKGITKAIESFRVSDNCKKELKILRDVIKGEE